MKTKRKFQEGEVALRRLRKQFPQLTKVRDATETIMVNVKPEDSASGRKKDPSSCALAKACVREKIADGAIIGIGYSWLIKGNVATRYKTTVGVSREITSFDRHQDFAAGKDYTLSRVSPANRLGCKNWPKSGPHKTTGHDYKHVHHTANIRVIKKFK